jgi:Fe-S-cluster containining protein
MAARQNAGSGRQTGVMSDAVRAGALGPWLDELRAALDGRGDTDVPCGECTACCTSSQFVHIAPDETDALAHIPKALLFPAPMAPKGHVLMGYDEHGRCPMLVDNRCSIYEHRPRTCRVYDCRVFNATGVAPDADKPAIAARAARWVFDLDADADAARAAALRAAAGFVGTDPDAQALGVNGNRHAVLAVRLADHFLPEPPDLDGARLEIRSLGRGRTGA